jgi:hypothetical protein
VLSPFGEKKPAFFRNHYLVKSIYTLPLHSLQDKRASNLEGVRCEKKKGQKKIHNFF